MGFTKATKKQAKARVALIGPEGSGKTWTGLLFARALAGDGGRVAVIDTENNSASKYADAFDFDTNPLRSFKPAVYIEAIREAEDMGYAALVIDSLSHAWMGKDGVLAMVDAATSRNGSGRGNAFTSGWKEVTPEHNALIDAIVQCRCHLIVTMRSKTEYVIETVNGKQVPRKVGMAPVQRDGMGYEFDVVGEMDQENTLVITKSRCPALAGAVYRKPGDEAALALKAWLDDGVAPAANAPPAAAGKPEPDALENVQNFKQALFQVFKARDFTPDDQKSTIAAILKGYDAKDVTALDLTQRHAVLVAASAGRCDKYKAAAPAAA